MVSEERTRRYVVELPDEGLDVAQLAERARLTDLAGARLLRTIYVPEDGSCFLLVEAASRAAAGSAARALGCIPGRVTSAVSARDEP